MNIKQIKIDSPKENDKLIASVKIKKEWKELFDMCHIEIEKAKALADEMAEQQSKIEIMSNEMAEQQSKIEIMSNEMWGKIRRESGFISADKVSYNEKNGTIDVYETGSEEEECDGDCENCDKD